MLRAAALLVGNWIGSAIVALLLTRLIESTSAPSPLRDQIVLLMWPLVVIASTVIVVVYVVRTTGPAEPTRAAGEVPARVAAPITPSAVPVSPPVAPQPEKRVFVPPSVSPQSINSFFDERTTAQGMQSVQGYLGKWMRFKGKVRNVQVFQDGTSVISFYVDRPKQSGLQIGVGAWFAEEWKDSVMLLNRDDEIALIGRIGNIGRLEVELRDCELTEQES